MHTPEDFAHITPPDWMEIDTTPLDQGEIQPFGFGYSREIGDKPRWRRAERVFLRKDRGRHRNYEEIHLMPYIYFVSDHGDFYNAATNRLLSTSHEDRNKLHILREDGRVIQLWKYRVIIDNFIEPPLGIKFPWRKYIRYYFNTVNHKDGCCWNNRLDNLQYSSGRDNVLHQNEVLKRGCVSKYFN